MADLEAEIKKDVAQKVQAAIAMTVSTGELPPDVSISMDKQADKPFPLAPGNKNVIIGEDGQPLKIGAAPAPRKNAIKGAEYTDEKYSAYEQWAETYFQKHGSMPNITLPSAAAEGWVPCINKIRYETKTIKMTSFTDVVKEIWGMIGEGTDLVADAVGIAAQYFTNTPADKVSEVVDGVFQFLQNQNFLKLVHKSWIRVFKPAVRLKIC